MVLAELGAKITGALRKLNNKVVVDEAALQECLNEIASALMTGDVNIKYIFQMQSRIKKRVMLKGDQGADMRKVVQESIVEELTSLLDGSAQSHRTAVIGTAARTARCCCRRRRGWQCC